MRVVWELEDIKVGRLVCKADCGLSGLWIIGWVPATEGEYRSTYGLVSLADGFFSPAGNSMEDLLPRLNAEGGSIYMPAELLSTEKCDELASDLFRKL